MEVFVLAYVGDEDLDYLRFVWADSMSEINNLLRDESNHIKNAPFKDIVVAKIPRRFGAVSLKQVLNNSWLYTDAEGHLKAHADNAAFEKEEGIWMDMASAPKDGEWILLRGRNAIGQPMIPVVAAWHPTGCQHFGWVDSSSFRPLDHLVAHDETDWAYIPGEE